MKLGRTAKAILVVAAGVAGVAAGQLLVGKLEQRTRREEARLQRQMFCETWTSDEASCQKLEALRSKLGAPVYSQNHEETVIRDFLAAVSWLR